MMASTGEVPAARFSSAYLKSLSLERTRTDYRGFSLALVSEDPWGHNFQADNST